MLDVRLIFEFSTAQPLLFPLCGTPYLMLENSSPVSGMKRKLPRVGKRITETHDIGRQKSQFVGSLAWLSC
jgi:hypothetical protein